QLATLVGIAFSLTFLAEAKRVADDIVAEREAAALAASEASDPSAVITPAGEPPHRNRRHWSGREHAIRDALKNPANPFGRLIERSPWWLFPLIAVIEFGGILLYLLQIPVTYALVRLEFESHWYIVTDRSLRIRSGLVSMQESTMSFANIQQVTVSQGPLQRLLGIADVRVQSAGGGSGSVGEGHSRDSMHTGIFHGVDNATEVRDLILERLRLFRAAGLGDPDDHHEAVAATAQLQSDAANAAQPALAAAQELLAEARALRAFLAAAR
ncbi:MAG TPA: PH domain-containing protein, partial [Opitutus sp.]|nr:PH domain-containing protein [Opitutus sp.]